MKLHIDRTVWVICRAMLTSPSNKVMIIKSPARSNVLVRSNHFQWHRYPPSAANIPTKPSLLHASNNHNSTNPIPIAPSVATHIFQHGRTSKRPTSAHIPIAFLPTLYRNPNSAVPPSPNPIAGHPYMSPAPFRSPATPSPIPSHPVLSTRNRPKQSIQHHFRSARKTTSPARTLAPSNASLDFLHIHIQKPQSSRRTPR